MAKATKKKTTGKRPKKTKPRTTLTELQHRFLREYIVCLNASEAAKRAGCKGKSPAHFSQLGYQMLQDNVVKKELAKFRARKFEERERVFDRVVEDLIFTATDDFDYTDITDLVEWDEKNNVKMKDYITMSPSARRSIKSIKSVFSKDGDVGIAVERKDTSQKIAAIKMIADYFGLKEYYKEIREKEREKDEETQSSSREKAEQTRMDRLLENATLYEERAGQKDSDNT